MKLTKSNGKIKISMSAKEWTKIGSQQGWIKKANMGSRRYDEIINALKQKQPLSSFTDAELKETLAWIGRYLQSDNQFEHLRAFIPIIQQEGQRRKSQAPRV